MNKNKEVNQFSDFSRYLFYFTEYYIILQNNISQGKPQLSFNKKTTELFRKLSLHMLLQTVARIQ